MALYYYARKLQKGAKVSQPCSYSYYSTSSSGQPQPHHPSQPHQTLTNHKCCKQKILPHPSSARLMTRTAAPQQKHCTQVQCHPHPHQCHTHCCSSVTHPCCGCNSSLPPNQYLLKQCPCHGDVLSQRLSQSRSLRSLEHLELSDSPSPPPLHESSVIEPERPQRPLPLHPPCCSMLHRSESQYENVDESVLRVEQMLDIGHHHGHHEMCKYELQNVDSDQEIHGEETCRGLQNYQNANNSGQNHLRNRQQNSTSTSTLTEDQFQFQEGNGDDDLDKEIQEIYAGKRVPKSGVVGSSKNYLHSSSSPTLASSSSRHRLLVQQPAVEEEEEEEDHTLCYNQKGQLISGTWESILEKVVIPWVENSSTELPDDETLNAFLLCSRLHNPPHLTLAFVFKHFFVKDKPSQSNGTHQNEGDSYQEEEASTSDAGGLNDSLPKLPIVPEFANDQQNVKEEEETGSDDEELNLDKLPQLVRFVHRWTELLPYDFRDDRVMHFVHVLSRICVDEDSEVRDEVSTLWTNLTSKLTALKVYESTLRRYKTESSIGEPIAAPSVVTICPSPASMAGQLSIVELEHFSFLGAQELVAQLLRKDRCRGANSATANVKDYSRLNGSVPSSSSSKTGTLMRCATVGTCDNKPDISGRLPGSSRGTCCGAQAPSTATNPAVVEAESDTQNLDAFISWFRRLAMYVASEICKLSKKKSRAKVIEYWIGVGKECLKIRNLNSLMAILAGLSCRPVARLKKTWSKINCADLIELQTAMDPKNNFSAYRAMYKASVWNSLTIPHGERHNYKILVPYFALLLRDVYNLNSLYPSKIKSNDHINFEKYTTMAKLINEIMSWKTMECPFTKTPSIYNAVQGLPVYTEREVTSASYGCEEPIGPEKEHFNRLKKDHSATPLPHPCRGTSPIHYLI